jgi:hypothetical protein
MFAGLFCRLLGFPVCSDVPSHDGEAWKGLSVEMVT